MQSWTRELDLSMMESKLRASGGAWSASGICICRPGALYKLEAHASILAPPAIPHEPHAHAEEEIVFVLSGTVRLIRVEPGGGRRESPALGRGAFSYHAAGRPHTLQSCGPVPAVYLCLKWTGQRTGNARFLESADFVPEYSFDAAKEWTSQPVLDSATQVLSRLRCHTSVMKPGFGYEPHADSHDVVLVVLDGKVATLGQTLGPDSVVYYQSCEPHGLKSIGNMPARYIVFEFHRGGLFRRLPRLAKAVLRRLS